MRQSVRNHYDFVIGFVKGKESGKEIITEKVNAALSDIQENIDSMKNHSEKHDKEIKDHAKAIVIGLELASSILNDHMREE